MPSKKNAQEIFWSEPVTHQVENVSNERMENIEIEFKKDKGAGRGSEERIGARRARRELRTIRWQWSRSRIIASFSRISMCVCWTWW